MAKEMGEKDFSNILRSYLQSDASIPALAVFNLFPTPEQLHEGGSTESFHLRRKVMDRPDKAVGYKNSASLEMWEDDRLLRRYWLELCFLAVDEKALPPEVLQPQGEVELLDDLVESIRAWTFQFLFLNTENNSDSREFFDTWIKIRCHRHRQSLPQSQSEWFHSFQPEEISKACSGLILLNRCLVYTFALKQPQPLVRSLSSLEDLNRYLLSFATHEASLGNKVFAYLSIFKPLCLRSQEKLHITMENNLPHAIQYQGAKFMVAAVRMTLKEALREAGELMDKLTDNKWRSCHPFTIGSVQPDDMTNDRTSGSVSLFRSDRFQAVRALCIQQCLTARNLSPNNLEDPSAATYVAARAVRELYYEKLMPLLVLLMVLGGQAGNGRRRSFTQARFFSASSELVHHQSLFLLADPHDKEGFLLVNLLTASKMDRYAGSDGIYHGAQERAKVADPNVEHQISVFLPEFAYLAVGVYAFATEMIHLVEESLMGEKSIDAPSYGNLLRVCGPASFGSPVSAPEKIPLASRSMTPEDLSRIFGQALSRFGYLPASLTCTFARKLSHSLVKLGVWSDLKNEAWTAARAQGNTPAVACAYDGSGLAVLAKQYKESHEKMLQWRASDSALPSAVAATIRPAPALRGDDRALLRAGQIVKPIGVRWPYRQFDLELIKADLISFFARNYSVTLRPHQAHVLGLLLQGQDVFVGSPPGSGKSLFAPALLVAVRRELHANFRIAIVQEPMTSIIHSQVGISDKVQAS